jgi:hypothetical protein
MAERELLAMLIDPDIARTRSWDLAERPSS